MDGILLVDKPKGWTSFDVVAKTRGILRAQTGVKKPKVGHAGTLDPMATGLLVLLIGSYCKQAEQFIGLDKAYQAEVTLGAASTTADTEGEITQQSDVQPKRTTVEQACEDLTGSYDQLPPVYSAKKVGGQRAYQLVRAGKTVKLQPKAITVYAISIVDYAYPVLQLTTVVSSGTYIRSLAVDIGSRLETGAYLTGLRRTRIGNFHLETAHTVDTLAEADDITRYIQQAAIDKT